MPWTARSACKISRERVGLTLPDGDYETVAGFLLERIGSIPSEGQQYRYGNVNFTITEMHGAAGGQGAHPLHVAHWR